jgi:glycerol-3-phosphate acyltransferase PlsY
MGTHFSPEIGLAVSLIGGYALGSIPFGVITTRLSGVGDIRSVGSGNIGATNVLRTGRRDLAAITLLGDGGKGAVAALLAGWLFSPAMAFVAGASAFIGHLFPVWLGFRGGKGVATFLGILFAIAWPVAIAACLTWLIVAAVFRFSSLAALAAAALTPVFFLALNPGLWWEAGMLAGMSAMIFLRHHENIGRLLKGAEPRIGAKKNAPPS